MKQKRSASELLFWTIFIFAGVVRFKDLSTGLPLHTLYGETDTLEILVGILKSGDLNPHHYDLPGLGYYFLLPFFYLFYQLGSLLGYFGSVDSVHPASFVFVGRVVCAFFGTLTVYLCYRLGKKISTLTGLLAMAILAAIPQHIEYSHMLRPEIPAIFFVLLAHEISFTILEHPGKRLYWIFGLAMGIAISLKYTIGGPLALTLIAVHYIKRKEARISWLASAFLAAAFVFLLTNPFLFINQEAWDYWQNRMKTLYVTGEDYYGQSTIVYYVEFLTRYNYNVPLMLFAGFGILWSFASSAPRAVLLGIYPLFVFFWLCSFETRRTHGLLPLHPFLALWAGLTLTEIWRITTSFSRQWIFKIFYVLLILTSLSWPYYRSMVQAYLFAQTDNRSRAELWMVNRLPRGSRIALLQFSQLELNPTYFQIENFIPRDYVLNNKDFRWFQQNGFDYIVVSSGQYMRYFIEGEAADRYKNYFRTLFQDAETRGALILDLLPHPLLIPDYRIKVFATRPSAIPAGFLPALEIRPVETTYSLSRSGIALSLDPGYYTLNFPPSFGGTYNFAKVTNLKLHETILRWRGAGDLTSFPFSVFPERLNKQFHLFATAPEVLSANQLVQFEWPHNAGGLVLEKIPPALRVVTADFEPNPLGSNLPFLVFRQNEGFRVRCVLRNRGKTPVAGYIEAYLSEIGEAQPWKNYNAASSAHEFYLEPAQRIAIEIPMNTDKLTGDYQLSYWVFLRRDLPFSPQNGGWFNRQIRIRDEKLGLHPIYGVQIP